MAGVLLRRQEDRHRSEGAGEDEAGDGEVSCKPEDVTSTGAKRGTGGKDGPPTPPRSLERLQGAGL